MADRDPSLEGRQAATLVDRRRLLLGGLFAATAGVTFARLPRERVDLLGTRKLETLVPDQIGPWRFLTTSGLVIPPEDALSAALYSNLLTRVYADGINPPLMLLIAQSAGQTGMLQVHRPEFCYPAGGYALSPTTERAIPYGNERFDANKLTAAIPGRIEQIIYWTRVGNRMPMTWRDQRLAIALDNLKGLVPDAVLVRVSTIDPDEQGAVDRLSAFVQAMLQSMSPAARAVLVSKT